MIVKRYDTEIDDWDNCAYMKENEDGAYVHHDDYAALEQQLAEAQRDLAAANELLSHIRVRNEQLRNENADLVTNMIAATNECLKAKSDLAAAKSQDVMLRADEELRTDYEKMRAAVVDFLDLPYDAKGHETESARERMRVAATPCEYCGPTCHGGAEHNQRVENGDKASEEAK